MCLVYKCSVFRSYLYKKNTRGSEYQLFQYQKHLNFLVFGFVLCTRSTIWIPDQYKRKQDNIHLFNIQIVWPYGIQIGFKYWTIWGLTSFQPFKYQTISVFRFLLYKYEKYSKDLNAEHVQYSNVQQRYSCQGSKRGEREGSITYVGISKRWERYRMAPAHG